MFSSKFVSLVLSFASIVGAVYANNDAVAEERNGGARNDSLFDTNRDGTITHRELQHNNNYNWENNDIVDVAVRYTRLSTLVEALQIAGYDDDLQCHNYSWQNCEQFSTVFAPTNAAFSDDAVSDVVDMYTTDSNYLLHLKSLIKYHIIARELSSQNIEDGAHLDTLLGESLDANGGWGNNIKINDATIIQADLWAKNGIIHIIDELLIPSFVTNNIVDVAASTGTFATLLSYATNAGLVDFLSDNENPVTLFAPTDDAFAKISDTLSTLTDDQIADVLTYHVVEGAIVNSDQLFNGQRVQTVLGEDINVSKRRQRRLQNGQAFFYLNDDARIIDADILASNGIIHVLNEVLIPPSFASSSSSDSSSEEESSSEGSPFFNNDNDSSSDSSSSEEDSSSDSSSSEEDSSSSSEEDSSEGSPFFPNDNNNNMNDDLYTIAEAVENDIQFDTLEAALLSVGLLDVFNDKDGEKLTIFAPKDSAFNLLGSSTVNDLLGTDELANILQYHVVPGEIFARDLENGGIEMLNGGIVTVDVDNQGVFLNGNAKVVTPDVQTANGVIHIIDQVLLPKTIVATAEELGLKRLVNAIDKAGLRETLEGPGPFTLLAPTNYAFQLLGPLSEFSSPVLQDILTYHVISGIVAENDLVEGDVQTVQGDDIEIEFKNRMQNHQHVRIIGGASSADVVDTDIFASNGVIHLINRVLLP